MNILRKCRNSAWLLACLCVWTLTGAFLAFPFLGEKAPTRDVVNSSEITPSMLCGLVSMHLALKRFAVENPSLEISLHELHKRFPDVEKNGMSLKQIQGVLSEKGIHTAFDEIKKSELVGMNPKTLFFALQMEEGKIPHIFFYYKAKNDDSGRDEKSVGTDRKIIKADYPNPDFPEQILADDDTKIFGMFASPDKDALPKKHFFKPLHLVSLACFLMAFAIFLYSKKKDREKAK